jgi:hypothetical protein
MVGFVGSDWPSWAISPGRRHALSAGSRRRASVAGRFGHGWVGFRE